MLNLSGDDDLAVFLDDVVIWRQADRRVGMRVVLDAPEDAFVNLGAADVDLVVFQFLLG